MVIKRYIILFLTFLVSNSLVGTCAYPQEKPENLEVVDQWVPPKEIRFLANGIMYFDPIRYISSESLFGTISDSTSDRPNYDAICFVLATYIGDLERAHSELTRLFEASDQKYEKQPESVRKIQELDSTVMKKKSYLSEFCVSSNHSLRSNVPLLRRRLIALSDDLITMVSFIRSPSIIQSEHIELRHIIDSSQPRQ